MILHLGLLRESHLFLTQIWDLHYTPRFSHSIHRLFPSLSAYSPPIIYQKISSNMLWQLSGFYTQCHSNMERNFDLSIYQMPEGIRARSQYPCRGKQSISNDRSIEKTVVQLMSIIPQSVAVSLSLHIPNCDITANERRQDGYIRGLKTTLQSLCDICEM